MMKRHFRAFAFACAAALAPLSASAQVVEPTVVEWNHNPASPNGPQRWGTLLTNFAGEPSERGFPFATCGSIPTTEFPLVYLTPPTSATDPFVQVGKKQTPIDIVTANTLPTAMPAITTQYVGTPFIVENTGHVVEVPVQPGSFIRVGQDTYQLLQFHLHAPSEHTVNGQLAAAELHLVHRNALLDLSVVGVLVQVGTPVNAAIERILVNAPIEEGGVDLDGALNPKDVLPQQLGYYTYSGSLTTPPCSEGVRWFVLKQPVFVSQEAINRFHEIIAEFPGYNGFPNNNRPVRPLNQRAVLDRTGP
jgi:carbonic anhydrase